MSDESDLQTYAPYVADMARLRECGYEQGWASPPLPPPSTPRRRRRPISKTLSDALLLAFYCSLIAGFICWIVDQVRTENREYRHYDQQQHQQEQIVKHLTGPSGAPGPAGGQHGDITSITLDPHHTGKLIVRYSDGSSQTVSIAGQ